jgi:membrane carboxypeptidase/penicillin-binding protein
MPPDFQAPANIVFLAVDKTNGAVLPADTTGAVHEAFISGTQPGDASRQPQ